MNEPSSGVPRRHARDWRHAFLGYWALWVGVTLLLGRDPGFVAYASMNPYPWFGVVVVCVLLGMVTMALWKILCPRTGVLRWRRVALAVMLAAVLFLVSAAAIPSDVPGYFYAPILYGLVSAVILLPAGWAILKFATAMERSSVRRAAEQ